MSSYPTASFNYDGTMPMINVDIKDQYGNWQTHRMMMDSVTGDARVYWKQAGKLRFGTMEDLFLVYNSSDPVDRETFEVLSIRRNPETGVRPKPKITANNVEVVFQKILGVIPHGTRDVWELTLRNGKSVEITKDHSIFSASSPKTAFESKPLTDLTEADFSHGGIVSIDDYAIDQSICEPVPMDENFLTFLGLWMADGSYGHYNYKDRRYLSGVKIATGKDQTIQTWLTEFRSKLPEPLKPRIQKNIRQTRSGTLLQCVDGRHLHMTSKGDVSIGGRALAKYVMSIFADVDSHSKRVPKFMFTATDKQIAAFLRGYFSGDGSCHLNNENEGSANFKYGAYYCVDCSSVNKELIDDISVLLDRLGIQHNVSDGYPSSGSFRSKHLQYKLGIHRRSAVKRFIEKVGFIKDFKYSERVGTSKFRCTKNETPAKVSLRRIRRVQYTGQKPVYDISVDETEAFVVNGILAHNSGNDTTLITLMTAQSLGFASDGRQINVQGIVPGVGRTFFQRDNTMIRIGNTEPMPITLLIGDTDINLIGRRDVFDNFEVTFTPEGEVRLTQRKGCAFCGV